MNSAVTLRWEDIYRHDGPRLRILGRRTTSTHEFRRYIQDRVRAQLRRRSWMTPGSDCLRVEPQCQLPTFHQSPVVLRPVANLISEGVVAFAHPLAYQEGERWGWSQISATTPSAIRVSAAWGVDRGRGQVPRLFPVRRTKGGAGGGSRTLTGLAALRIFVPGYGFRRPRQSAEGTRSGLGSGLSLHHVRRRPGAGAARLVSTPSRRKYSPPGLARDSHADRCRFRVPRVWAVLHRRFPGGHSSYRLKSVASAIPPRPRGYCHL